MDKEYMLKAVRRRINELEKKYRTFFNGKSAGADAVKRSKCLKELGLAKLIETLLVYCPDTLDIDDFELVKAFDRLTEPRR